MLATGTVLLIGTMNEHHATRRLVHFVSLPSTLALVLAHADHAFMVGEVFVRGHKPRSWPNFEAGHL